MAMIGGDLTMTLRNYAETFEAERHEAAYRGGVEISFSARDEARLG